MSNVKRQSHRNNSENVSGSNSHRSKIVDISFPPPYRPITNTQIRCLPTRAQGPPVNRQVKQALGPHSL